jgi:crotonobetainyl-CoA:carnitine CoA-transferase CaiB-like acyl-CoA transferase
LLPYQNPDDERTEEVISIFSNIFLTKTRDEWCEGLRDVGVARVDQLDELVSDSQIAYRGMLVDIKRTNVFVDSNKLII